jgi:Zn-dependent protease with chaperone function
MSLAPRRRAQLLLLVVLLGFATVAALGLRLWWGDRGAAGCGCVALMQAPVTPDGWRLLGLAAAGSVGIVVAAAAGQAVRVSRRARATLAAARLGRRTVQGTRVAVVAGSGPRAFCVGGWRPEVAVTTGVLALEPAEQRAVLAHERAHARARDPFAFAFLETLSRVLPFLAPVADEYRRLAEFAADDAARGASGDAAFAAVLVKAVEPSPVYAAGFSPTEARIRRFLGHTHALPRRRFAAALIGFGVTLVLLAVGSVNGQRAAARETHAMCRIESVLCARPTPPSAGVCVSTASGTVCLR